MRRSEINAQRRHNSSRSEALEHFYARGMVSLMMLGLFENWRLRMCSLHTHTQKHDSRLSSIHFARTVQQRVVRRQNRCLECGNFDLRSSHREGAVLERHLED